MAGGRSHWTRRATLFGVALYIVLFDVAYATDVHTVFDYMGFGLAEIDLTTRATLWAIAWIPCTWLPVAIARPSQVVYWFLFLLVYIPSMLVPIHVVEHGASQLWLLAGVLFFAFLILGVPYRRRLLAIRPPAGARNAKGTFILVMGVVAACLYGYVIFVFGVSFDAPSLMDVYDLRDQHKAVVAQSGRMGAYAIAWTANVLNPLIMAVGLVKRRPALIAIGGAGQLMLFSITGFKSIIFSTALLLGLVAAASRGGRQFGLWVTWGSVAVVLLSMVEIRVLGSRFLSAVVFRRVFVVPGLATGFYFDFFTQNPKALLGHGILSGLVDYPYSVPPPQLVAPVYFGSTVMHANANLWADGFANFGYVGILGTSVLLAGLLHTYDSVTTGRDRRVAIALMGMPAITLSNSAVLTSILTHGIWLAIVLGYVMPEIRIRLARGSTDR